MKKFLIFIVILLIFPDSIKVNSSILLINKNNPLPKSYIPNNLTHVSYIHTFKDIMLDYDCYMAYIKLYNDSNLPFIIYSGYRSYEYQQLIYVGDKYQAKPGESEHQSGLAIDVTIDGVGLHEEFGHTKEGKWLNDNCHKYGFIIRYPKNKEAITGFLYEPWHIRYVGIDVAHIIYKNDITLEEYINNNY